MLTIEATETAVAFAPVLYKPSLPPPTPSTSPIPPAPRTEQILSAAPATPAKPAWPTFNPTPSYSPAAAKLVRKALQESEEDERDDPAPLGINLKTTDDDPDMVFIAKRLLSALLDDISGKSVGEPDLFGDIQHNREFRKLDALAWLYNLNPDGAVVSFDAVCDELGTDGEILRRVIARNMRQELKRLLKMLACMVSEDHAINCECELAQYVNLAGWKDN